MLPIPVFLIESLKKKNRILFFIGLSLLLFLSITGVKQAEVSEVKTEEKDMVQEGTKTETAENKVEDWELVWSDEFMELIIILRLV